MADQDVHLKPLPPNVRAQVMGHTPYSEEQNQETFDKFLKKSFRKDEEECEAFKRLAINLTKTRRKNNEKQHRHTLKRLSYRQRKQLGLYTLPRHSVKYSEIRPLHNLWKEYMREFLKLNEIMHQGWNNTHEDPNFEAVSIKLYRADYHGCEMKVTRSCCPSYVGKSGVVAMETKNCFRLVSKDDIVRTIPKDVCEFEFSLDEFQFSFFGKNLQVKPADRSSKKLKTVQMFEL